MSETTHTPGPWVVEGDWVTDVATDGNICEVSMPSSEDEAEQAANAHLIAAAPDLLAALRRFMDYGDVFQWSGKQSPYSQALAAIAKAEGR
jgi:hypothetical protein